MNTTTTTEALPKAAMPFKRHRDREETKKNSTVRAIHLRLPFKTDIIAQALKKKLEADKGREVSWPVFLQHLLHDASARGGVDLEAVRKADRASKSA